MIALWNVKRWIEAYGPSTFESISFRQWFVCCHAWEMSCSNFFLCVCGIIMILCVLMHAVEIWFWTQKEWKQTISIWNKQNASTILSWPVTIRIRFSIKRTKQTDYDSNKNIRTKKKINKFKKRLNGEKKIWKNKFQVNKLNENESKIKTIKIEASD